MARSLTRRGQMSVQLGDIWAAYIYMDDDKYLYHRGNTSLVIINLIGIGIFLATKAYYVWRNKQRDKIWEAMTVEQRKDYIQNTKLQGSRRLDFRFAH